MRLANEWAGEFMGVGRIFPCEPRCAAARPGICSNPLANPGQCVPPPASQRRKAAVSPPRILASRRRARTSASRSRRPRRGFLKSAPSPDRQASSALRDHCSRRQRPRSETPDAMVARRSQTRSDCERREIRASAVAASEAHRRPRPDQPLGFLLDDGRTIVLVAPDPRSVVRTRLCRGARSRPSPDRGCVPSAASPAPPHGPRCRAYAGRRRLPVR